MYRKMLNFSRPNVPRINSSCLTFLHMPSILMYYTIYESISDAAAHNFGWDDTGGTGDRNKFRANNEICGRDCKVLRFALSLHLLLALLCPILTTLSILTQTGETIKHNQPHTQVDFRAFQSLRFHLLPGLNIYGVIRTTEDNIGSRESPGHSHLLLINMHVSLYPLYGVKPVTWMWMRHVQSSTVCLDLSECACCGSNIMHL